MNRGRQANGYTIVEVLMFLAVSALLFVSTMAIFSGKQGETEFTQSARDFEVVLQGIANDVSTGYYANVASGPSGSLKCSVSGGSVQFGAAGGADTQGTNEACIFIGKTIQFRPLSNAAVPQPSTYDLIALAGKRKVGPNDSDSIAMSGVTPFGFPSTTNYLQSKQVAFSFGCVFYVTSPTAISMNSLATTPCTGSPAGSIKTDSISFVTTFVQTNAQLNRNSGDTDVNLMVHSPLSLLGNGRSVNTVMGEVSSYATTSPTVNPAGGVYICLQSEGSDQHGLLRLGGNGSRFATDLQIDPGTCS